MAAAQKSNKKLASGPKSTLAKFDEGWKTEQELKNSHELEVLKSEQGPIGQLIGCSDSPLTIAFVLLLLGFGGLVMSGIGMIWQPDAYWKVIEILTTFELTIAGYVMGKKSGS